MKVGGRTHPFDPDWVVHPGATLQEWIDESHLPMKSIVRMSGLTEDQLRDVISGSLKITPEIAEGLERGTLGVSARFWLAMEHNFRVGLAAGKHWHGQERAEEN